MNPVDFIDSRLVNEHGVQYAEYSMRGVKNESN